MKCCWDQKGTRRMVDGLPWKMTNTIRRFVDQTKGNRLRDRLSRDEKGSNLWAFESMM